MKFIRSCLVSIIFLLTIVFTCCYFYSRSVNQNIKNYRQDVDVAWNAYKTEITKRDFAISNTIHENDSLLKFASNLPLENISPRTLEHREYRINKSMLNANLLSKQHKHLNTKLEQYNSSVRKYNQYRSTFPRSLILRKSEFPRNLDYVRITYGQNNDARMLENKQFDRWIETGEGLK